MPNWTTNYLYVEGTSEAIENVKAAYKKSDPTSYESDVFDFEHFLPVPEVLWSVTAPVTVVETEAEAEKINRDWERDYGGLAKVAKKKAITREESNMFLREYGATNWYDWSLVNWGVKWNSGGADIMHSDDNRFVVRFDTAWNEPNAFIEHLRELEGIKEVESVAVHEGGDEPSTSEGWERFFQMDTEGEVDDEGENYSYSHTLVSYLPECKNSDQAG